MYYLPQDPQENTCFPFENNISTRILEKDYFVRNHSSFPNNAPHNNAPGPAGPPHSK
jgi:hypothetical protein